uniref:Uncharacterized protein n=1 Tax=Arundo donax TaxID=35708 RepID=A0A0A9G3S2_ARUDO
MSNPGKEYTKIMFFHIGCHVDGGIPELRQLPNLPAMIIL